MDKPWTVPCTTGILSAFGGLKLSVSFAGWGRRAGGRGGAGGGGEDGGRRGEIPNTQAPEQQTKGSIIFVRTQASEQQTIHIQK